MEEIRYSGGKEICVALGVTILLALFLFRVEDSYRIGLLLVAGHCCSCARFLSGNGAGWTDA